MHGFLDASREGLMERLSHGIASCHLFANNPKSVGDRQLHMNDGAMQPAIER